MNERIRQIGPSALVFGVAFLVYANALGNGFAFDDVFIVQHNSRVHDLTDLRAIWLRPYWPSFGAELGLWRPLVIFGYAVQWAIVGDQPWFFHLVSILLHCTVSVLGFLVLRQLTKSVAAALVGALIFAVHPVHTEVVANIVGQAELIAAVTTLAACLVYITRGESPDLSWPRRIVLLLLFLAGVLAKESAIVLPGLLVILDLAQNRVTLSRAGVRRYATALVMPMFLFAATAVFYFSLRVGVLGSIGGVDAAPSLGFLREEHRVLIAFRGWIEYVRLMVFPLELSADYSPGVILPVEGWTPMVTLGALILIGTAVLATLTPVLPGVGLPAAWLLITMLPTSNIFMPIGVVVAERLLYTPSFALSVLVAFAWRHTAWAELPVRSRRLAYGACLLVVVLFGVRSWIRNPDWKSTTAVLTGLARDHPESYRSQWHNASLAYQAGHIDIANGYMQLAFRIWPNDPELLNELAFGHLGRAQFDSAAVFVERARSITPWIARTHILLAQAYIGQGRFDQALVAVTQAQRLGTSPMLTYSLQAQAYEGLGEMDLAVAAWDATTRHAGEFWNYWARYARALARHQLTDRARLAADSAIALAPARDTAVERILGRLRLEIAAGCYATDRRAPRDGDCKDPIGEWKLLAPIVVNRPPENASKSQNATSGAGSASQSDTGSAHVTIEDSIS